MDTIRELIKRGEEMLLERGVPNARRNVEWILCDTLGCSMLDLYTGSVSAPAGALERYWERIRRRAGREPLQHILGTTEFMSLPFRAAPGVFVPRPDTEVLVEAAERWLRGRGLEERLSVLDLCCGSGVIGVSLASRIANVEVQAVDVSAEAVASTEHNARLNGVEDRVRAWRADAAAFLDEPPVAGRFTAILCNPPYIESGEIASLPPEVRGHEPRAALDGGVDGLDSYRALVARLPKRLIPGGLAMFEIGDAQAHAVSGMLAENGFDGVHTIRDFTGHDRVVAGVLSRKGDG